MYILFCNDYTIILRSDDALVLPRCYSKASRCRRAYILPLWFSFFFFFFFFSTPNLWGLAFWDRYWTLTEHISAVENGSNNRKKTCQSVGTPLHFSQIWWTLVHKRLRKVGEFLHTHKFSHWKTLPALPHGRYITDSRQTLARVM